MFALCWPTQVTSPAVIQNVIIDPVDLLISVLLLLDVCTNLRHSLKCHVTYVFVSF